MPLRVEPQPSRLYDNPKTIGDFRDPRFVEDELFLDAMLETDTIVQAPEVEAEFLAEARQQSYISEGLARVSLKAVALAQLARQRNVSDHPSEDTTYQNLGMLIDKSLNERRRITKDRDDPNRVVKLGKITGIITEMTQYALLAYDQTLTYPLTRRSTYGHQRHFIYPSTALQDIGYTDDNSHSTGYDYSIAPVSEPENVRYIQAKTSDAHARWKKYAPHIDVIYLHHLASLYPSNVRLLAESIRNDSQGQRDYKTYRHINSATRRLYKVLDRKSN